MELIESKKIIVGDKKFSIRYSNRAALMYYNRISKDPDDPESLFHYFYDLAKAGAEDEKETFAYTFEEFSELIDRVPGIFGKFMEVVAEYMPEDDTKKKTK